MYLSNSNILLTRFLSPDGVAEVCDFMPISLESWSDRVEPVHQLIRRAKCVRGDVKFEMTCDPRLDYGRAKQSVKLLSEKEALFTPDSGDSSVKPIRLRAEVPLAIREGQVEAEFVLRAGEKALFILEGDEDAPHEINPNQVGELFKATLNFWQSWISKSTYRGRWREIVDRSALVLKLLVSQRHGSIVAAPTFGLPEAIGAGRNWDYRYTWIRDSSFTLYALNRLGFESESKAFMQWLEARCRDRNKNEPLQIMYGTDGRKNLTEVELTHWEGYRGSAPVRIGNAAQNQLQLDIYGELLDSIYLYNKYGEPISHGLWSQLSRLIEWVCENWDQPDEGIWEVRGGTQHLFYSRLMCWVAVDRAIRLAERRSFPAPVMRWLGVRDAIYHQIHSEFWNEELQSFVQTKNGKTLDAACLLAPLVKFISPTDPRWLSTLRAIDQGLVDDSLVYRYRTEDGLMGTEGTFCMCSFWLIECLARSNNAKKSPIPVREDVGLRQSLGPLRRRVEPVGRASGQFPAGIYAFGVDQRCL